MAVSRQNPFQSSLDGQLPKRSAERPAESLDRPSSLKHQGVDCPRTALTFQPKRLSQDSLWDSLWRENRQLRWELQMWQDEAALRQRESSELHVQVRRDVCLSLETLFSWQNIGSGAHGRCGGGFQRQSTTLEAGQAFMAGEGLHTGHRLKCSIEAVARGM